MTNTVRIEKWIELDEHVCNIVMFYISEQL